MVRGTHPTEYFQASSLGSVVKHEKGARFIMVRVRILY